MKKTSKPKVLTPGQALAKEVGEKLATVLFENYGPSYTGPLHRSIYYQYPDNMRFLLDGVIDRHLIFTGVRAYNFAVKSAEKHLDFLVRRNQLVQLIDHIGEKAVRGLQQKKAVLCIWRGSTPHNTYVEPLDKPGEFLWHSDGWDCPRLALFNKLSDSGDRIPYSWIHGEGGQPFQTTYALKPEFRDPELIPQKDTTSDSPPKKAKATSTRKSPSAAARSKA